jgi:hypothetical protein
MGLPPSAAQAEYPSKIFKRLFESNFGGRQKRCCGLAKLSGNKV